MVKNRMMLAKNRQRGALSFGAGVGIGIGIVLLVILTIVLVSFLAMGRCPLCGRMMNDRMMDDQMMERPMDDETR